MTRPLMKIGTRTAHVPGSDLRAAALLVASRAASSCSPTTWRSAPAPSTRRPSCAPSDPSPGAPPTCSPRAGPTDGRYGDNPVPPAALLPVPGGDQALAAPTSWSSTWEPAPRSASTRWCTTSASSRTTGSRPTLGAWGLGWEVWLNGMEITQFTYFQQVGGLDCRPVTGEITYGLERLAMYLQGVESIYRHRLDRRPAAAASPTATCSTRTRSSSRPTTSSTPTSTCCCATSTSTRAPASELLDGEAGAAGLRAGAQGLAHLQPARCAPRDLRHRAAALHPARARAGARGGAGVLREPRGARLPAAAGTAPRRQVGHGARRPQAPAERRVTRRARLPGRDRHRGAAAEGAAHARAGAGRAASARASTRRDSCTARSRASPRRAAWRCTCKRLAAAAPEQTVKRRGPPLACGLRRRGRADARRARLRRRAAASTSSALERLR